MGRLTTHVLDTANGRPAAGVLVEIYRVDSSGERMLGTAITNDDGRCDRALAEGETFVRGVYELRFHVGSYFRDAAPRSDVDGSAFLDVVPVRFGVAAPDEHYHVPLLISPFAYSTYRGS